MFPEFPTSFKPTDSQRPNKTAVLWNREMQQIFRIEVWNSVCLYFYSISDNKREVRQVERWREGSLTLSEEEEEEEGLPPSVLINFTSSLFTALACILFVVASHFFCGLWAHHLSVTASTLCQARQVFGSQASGVHSKDISLHVVNVWLGCSTCCCPGGRCFTHENKLKREKTKQHPSSFHL